MKPTGQRGRTAPTADEVGFGGAPKILQVSRTALSKHAAALRAIVRAIPETRG